MSDDEPKQPVRKVGLMRRQQLEQHLRSSPTDLDAFMELAQIYRSESRPLDATRVLKQAHEIFPDDQRVNWEYEEAVLARSLQQFREVTDLDNRLNTSVTARELKRSQHDWARRRIDVCSTRLTRDPSMLHLRIVLAEALYDAEQYDDSLQELEGLLEVDEFSPQANLLRGKCFLALEQDIDAMAALRLVALRRAVPAPAKLRIVALRMLCETADRLGIPLSTQRYQQVLQQVETP